MTQLLKLIKVSFLLMFSTSRLENMDAFTSSVIILTCKRIAIPSFPPQ